MADTVDLVALVQWYRETLGEATHRVAVLETMVQTQARELEHLKKNRD